MSDKRGPGLDGAKYRLELVEKTFALLDCFTPDERELSLRDLEERTGLASSSVYRIVANLTRLRILEQDANTRKLRIGAKLYALGSLAVLDLRRIAMPVMERLRARFGFTVNLAVVEGHAGVLVEVLDSPRPYGVSAAIGSQEPLYCTASGKCILAFLLKDERDEALRSIRFVPFTQATLTSSQALKSELEEIRRSGVAYDRGEWAPHVRCAAVPIFDRNELVIGTLGLSGSEEEEFTDEARGDLLVAGSAVSRELGYVGVYIGMLE